MRTTAVYLVQEMPIIKMGCLLSSRAEHAKDEDCFGTGLNVYQQPKRLL